MAFSFLPIFLLSLILMFPTTLFSLNPAIHYDGRSLILNGTRTMIMSGTLHYTRIHPNEWSYALDLVKAMNLNTVQTYAFWSYHSSSINEYNFEDSGKNISQFVELAQEKGLYVVFRLGPYICGEYDGGSIPSFMRYSNASCFRCRDPSWENNSQLILAQYVKQLQPYFYPQGPIIDLQVENEYDYGEVDYLTWAVDAARNLTTDIPWNLCHDLDECSVVNANSTATGGKALCTINGFWMEQVKPFVNQPAPVWINTQIQSNPLQPIIWTEDQGWYDYFGGGKRFRYSSDQLYGVLRFIAYGGTWHNFYCFSGGNNYGYIAGFAEGPIATNYAPDTAVDSFLLRHEPRYSFYASFFQILNERSTDLLNNPAANPPLPIKGFTGCELQEYNNTVFLSNTNDYNTSIQTITYQNKPYTLPPWTVIMVDKLSGNVLFNTSSLSPPEENRIRQTLYEESVQNRSSIIPSLSSSNWEYYVEPFGYGYNQLQTNQLGIYDQVNLTGRVLSDYMYFTVTLPTSYLSPEKDKNTVNVITGGGEYVYVYINDELVNATGSGPFFIGKSFNSTNFSFNSTDSQLTVLSSSMGFYTGGLSFQPSSAKGLLNVTVNNHKLDNNYPVQYKWLLEGEEKTIFNPNTTGNVNWVPVSSGNTDTVQSTPSIWLRSYFDRPARDPSANQTSYVMDLTGLNKGVVWVNGFNLGRYSLELGACVGGDNKPAANYTCAPPYHGNHCYLYWKDCNLPTQNLYHVPAPLVQDTNNLVVIFEETNNIRNVYSSGGNPILRNLNTVQLLALHVHPF